MGGREAPLSIFSLPRVPLQPRTQKRVIAIVIVEKVVITVKIHATRGWGLEIVRRVARESGQIRL